MNHYLYSPAATYPRPEARLIAEDGTVVQAWSHPHGQAPAAEHPPGFLRGWNHVELEPTGGLLVIVRLQSLMRLDRDSRLAWSCPIAAHHDLAVGPDGDVRVLTETPRLVSVDGEESVILDQEITFVDGDGTVRMTRSLFDVLSTDPATRASLLRSVTRRRERFDAEAWSATVDLDPDRVARTRQLLRTARFDGPHRQALQYLRQLPGNPCNAIHANTIELLPRHPAGIWGDGSVLVSLRNLDLVAVLDPALEQVLWSWGEGELSRQHQPSLTPDGTVLVFDNGRRAGRSRLVEIDPVTDRIVWCYQADPPESMFSDVAGGCEVLPDGTILVADAQAGRAFRLNRDREVVWEWRAPPGDTADRPGRVSFYRLAAVADRTVQRLLHPEPARC